MRFTRPQHCSDDALIALGIAAARETFRRRSAEADDADAAREALADHRPSVEDTWGATAFHVGRCAPCAARYRDLTSAFDDEREALAREADAGFTREVAARQLQSILHRLDAGRAARVLSFPVRGLVVRPHSLGRRIMAATAAVVAMLGLGIGALRLAFDVGAPRSGAQRVATRSAPLEPKRLSTDSADDELLSAVDALVMQPRITELTALDALTPRVDGPTVTSTKAAPK